MVIGVDPHKRLNAVVVINAMGKVLARRQFPSSAEGFGELRSFGRQWRLGPGRSRAATGWANTSPSG
jgi:hypothetical protein